MRQTSLPSSAAVAAALLTLALLAGLMVPPPAAGQPDDGNTGAAAEVGADLATVHQSTLLGLDVAELEIGRARGEVGDDIAGAGSGDLGAHALANNLEASVLDALDLEELLVHAEQTSPPDADVPDSEELTDLSLEPLLEAGVATVSARALTGDGTGCLGSDESYTVANADLAGVGLLTDGDEPLIGLTGRDDEEVVSSRGTIEAVDHPDVAGDAVRATATADLAAVELAGYQVGVISQPHLSVTSVADGAADVDDLVEWTAPAVEIRDPDGDVVAELDADDGATEFEIPDVATVSLGTVDAGVAPDGTVDAEGELLRIDVAEALSDLVHTDVAIAPLSASATTPDGGIDCPDPLEGVHKEISQGTVSPGDTFTYSIVIPNAGPCTLVDVHVVDEITGPDGSEVTATRPPADDVDGLTVTWDDVGPIEPGEEVTLELDVAVPAELTDSTNFSEDLSITADCDGQPVEHETEIEGPRVIDRVSGPERVRTGIEVSEDAFETATAAVLARSDEFPDALTASSLAAEVGGPILVNPPHTLRDDVGDELERLEVETVYLAGGTAALSADVETDVQQRGIDTVRLDGDNRYHTAELIADEVADLGGPVQHVVLARDDLFPDALAAGNLATWARAPILLTPSDRLHGNAQRAMTDSDVVAEPEAFVAGGTQAVGTGAEQDARDLGFAVERLAGAERYATAVAITERVVEATGATLDPLYLASGRDFSDALVAGPAAFATGGSLTLVDAVDLDISHASRDFLAANREAIGQVKIVGGTAAISQEVVEQILEALED